MTMNNKLKISPGHKTLKNKIREKKTFFKNTQYFYKLNINIELKNRIKPFKTYQKYNYNNCTNMQR